MAVARVAVPSPDPFTVPSLAPDYSQADYAELINAWSFVGVAALGMVIFLLAVIAFGRRS